MVVDEETAWTMNYFSWNWHHRWEPLGSSITEGKLNIVMSPMVVSLLNEWEYGRVEALGEEAEREADNVRRLEDEHSKSLWLGDVILSIWEILL